MRPDAPMQPTSRFRTLSVAAPVLALLLTAGLADISPDDLENDGDVFDKLELDEAKAGELFDQFEACDMDPKELIVGLAQLFKEEPLTPDEQACFDDALTPEAIRASFVGSLLGEEVPDDPTDPTNCVDLGLDAPEGPDVSPPTTR